MINIVFLFFFSFFFFFIFLFICFFIYIFIFYLGLISHLIISQYTTIFVPKLNKLITSYHWCKFNENSLSRKFCMNLVSLQTHLMWHLCGHSKYTLFYLIVLIVSVLIVFTVFFFRITPFYIKSFLCKFNNERIKERHEFFN